MQKQVPSAIYGLGRTNYSVSGFGSSIGKRTKGGWLQIQFELDQNRPVVMILVRVRGFFGNITKNHQVVAIGYKTYFNNQVSAVQIMTPTIRKKRMKLCTQLSPAEIKSMPTNGHAEKINRSGASS